VAGHLDLRRTVGGILDTIKENAKAVRPLQKRWAGAMKKLAVARITGDLAPWAKSTQRKYELTRTSAVTAQGNVRKSYAKQLDRRLRRTVDARSELRRLVAGGNTGKAFSLLEGDEKRNKRLAVERLRRNLEKAKATGKRVGGDARKADKHQLLGRLRTAWVVVINGLSTTLKNAVPFSEKLRSGGALPNGATAPERNFLFISSSDARLYAQIAKEHLLGVRY